MKVAASRIHKAAGVLMVVAALAYLVPFVPRGWIPHDEGMLGQSADRVLQGGIPHIDYEEPYTGGLSWLYAATFRISGADLLNVRWLLLAAASWAACLMHAIFRRFLRPTGAALATWVAIAWSFPNYFAGLPSWWLLLCALACVWAVIRFVETRQPRYLAAAGLAVGIAVAIKQTGVYLLVALVLSLLYDGGQSRHNPSAVARLERWTRWGAAAGAIALAAVILGPRLLRAEGPYLFLPVAACALVVLLPFKPDSEPSDARSPLTVVSITMMVAALPLACLLIPYVVRDRLWDFVNGSILLPRQRLAFASAPMPAPFAMLTAIPLLALVFPLRGCGSGSLSTPLKSLLWAASIALPIAALWNVSTYQLIWQSSRAFASLLPLGICWQLASGQVKHPNQRLVLFVSAAMLAWASLNQFPFAAPIYFCYVAPLAVVAAVAAAGAGADCRSRQAMVPWAVLLLLFAVLSANRAYIESLGVYHSPRRFDAPLNLKRAHLNVSRDDARVYRRLVASILSRPHGGQLIAGPDCPEVFFLSGLVNPSGALFDFFSEDAGRSGDGGTAAWSKGNVIVLNHAPHFSPAPSERLTADLRREFPFGEVIGPFEVRWR